MGAGLVFGIGLALMFGSLCAMLSDPKRFDGFWAFLCVVGVVFMVLGVVSIIKLQNVAF